MALRWKKDEPERGLARVMAGPRGSALRDGGHVIARVAVCYEGWGRVRKGWFWWANSPQHGVPLKNTAGEPVADEATAKAQALAYVKQCLAEAKRAATTEKEKS